MADYLDLRDDCLAGPTRWDLAVVEAWMLWPHDPEIRKRCIGAVSVKLQVAAIDQIPLRKPTPTEVREYGEMLLTAPRIEDFTEAAKKCYFHGIVAGFLLIESTGGAGVDSRYKSLTDIKNALADRYARLSPKTITNTVWPRYRPVAHFWAAHFLETKDPEGWVFPCRMRDLALFLATAEAFRRRGEKIRSNLKSPTTVLRQGQAIMIPPALALPEVELTFN